MGEPDEPLAPEPDAPADGPVPEREETAPQPGAAADDPGAVGPDSATAAPEPTETAPENSAPEPEPLQQAPAEDTPPPQPPADPEPPVLERDPPTLERVSRSGVFVDAAPRSNRGLIFAAIATGIIQFLLSITAARVQFGGVAKPESFGYMIGALVFWPLLVAGLFAIGKRFRNWRTLLIILNVVWGLFIVGHLGNLMSPVPRRMIKTETHLDPDKLRWNNTPAPAPVPSFGTSLPEDVVVPGPDGIDFSAGSDDRLVKVVQGSQLGKYRETLDAYDRAVERNPDNARLAVERAKFIDFYAFSDDYPIKSADEDRDKAVQYLKDHFARRPEAVVYLMGQEYGDDLEDKLEEFRDVERFWPEKYRAQFLLIRARATRKSWPLLSLNDARESLKLKPTVEAAMLVAEVAQASGHPDDALEALSNPVLVDAQAWIQKRRVELYFKLHETRRALEIFDNLKKSGSAFLSGSEMAESLAEAGRLKDAREVLGRQSVGSWNREEVMRERYEFEKRHGDAGSILEAYRNLRALGLHTDPFGRERLDLLLKYPGTAWTGADFAGVFSTLLLFLGMLLAPLVVIVPVHYWSLLRERKGRTPGWPGAKWGLRHVWLLTGVMLLVDAVGVWWWQPEQLRAWVTDGVKVAPIGDGALLTIAFIGWGVLGTLIAVLLTVKHAWRMFGTGSWRFGKGLGYGLLVMGSLKIVAVMMMVLFPHIRGTYAPAYAGQTEHLILAIKSHLGFAGVVGCIAIIVPFVEEFLFRGVMLQGLAKHIPFGWANVVQAAVFALMHEDLRLFPAFFVFALGCGILARRSGSLGPSLIAHFANNFLAAVRFAF